MYLTSRKEKKRYLGGGGIASLILLRIFTTVLSEKNELFSESGHVHQTSSILLCSDAQNNLCCSYYFCNTIKFGHKKLAIGFSSSKVFKELFYLNLRYLNLRYASDIGLPFTLLVMEKARLNRVRYFHFRG